MPIFKVPPALGVPAAGLAAGAPAGAAPVVGAGVGAGAGVYGACEVDWGDGGRYGFGGGWW